MECDDDDDDGGQAVSVSYLHPDKQTAEHLINAFLSVPAVEGLKQPFVFVRYGSGLL